MPAVALTAYARSEDRMKAILAGFQMHVAKPVEAGGTAGDGGVSGRENVITATVSAAFVEGIRRCGMRDAGGRNSNAETRRTAETRGAEEAKEEAGGVAQSASACGPFRHRSLVFRFLLFRPLRSSLSALLRVSAFEFRPPATRIPQPASPESPR